MTASSVVDLELALITATAEASRASGEVARIAAELMRALRAEQPAPMLLAAPAEPEEWLTVKEAAARLNRPASSISALMRRATNPLPHSKIGRSIRIPLSRLEMWAQGEVVA